MHKALISCRAALAASLLASPALAIVTVYTDEAAFLAAAGEGVQLETFNSITEEFQMLPGVSDVASIQVSVSGNPDETMFSGLQFVSMSGSGSIDGTTFLDLTASPLVEDPIVPGAPRTPTLLFPEPTNAIAFTYKNSFQSGNSAGVSMIIAGDLIFIDDLVELVELAGGFKKVDPTFLGFVSTSDFDNVLFFHDNAGVIASFEETFSLDDLRYVGPPIVTPCAGDANNDGAVNVDDFIAVLLNFGASGTDIVGDANNDDTVNVDDFIAVLLNFGACNPLP